MTAHTRRPRRSIAQPATAPAVERIPWVRPIFEAPDAIVADIRAALASGHVTNDGPYVREFERRLAGYLGVGDCVAVASGSAALVLALHVLGLRGAKVLLPSFTFIATLNAVVEAGLTPVFCDIDPDTWTVSPAHVETLLAADASIRLVLPVNVFGVPPDMRALRRIVDPTAAVLMLDNAHGLGTERDGVRCPGEAAVQTFSFHATKMLPAGEGGAVVASDDRVLAEIRRLRNHGIAGDPLASTSGYNAKMSELHAAVALHSLADIDAALGRRRAYAERLRRVVADDCASLCSAQHVPDSVRSNFQNLGVVCHDDVGTVQAAMAEATIETRRYFYPPLHELPAHRGGTALPVTERIGNSVLCLPLYSRMEPGVLQRIETALRRVACRADAVARLA